MPSPGRSRLARRIDSRKFGFGAHGRWLDRLSGSGVGWSSLVWIGFFVVATAVVLSSAERLDYVINQTLDRPITARVDFQRVNENKTAQAREARRRATPNHYRLNQPLLDRVAGELRELLRATREADTFDKFAAANATRWPLDEAGYNYLVKFQDKAGTDRYDEWVRRLAALLANEALIQRPTTAERDPLTESAEDVILVRQDGRPVRVSKQRIGHAGNEEHVRRVAKDLAETFPPPVRAAVAATVSHAIAPVGDKEKVQAVFVFDRALTQAALEEATRVNPIRDLYKRGDLLLPAGTVITADLLDLLEHEHLQYMQARRTDPQLWEPWFRRRLGATGLVLLCVLGIALYTRRFQPRVLENPMRSLALAGLLAFSLLISRLVLGGHYSQLWTITPVVIAATILSIAYSQRFAFGMSASLAALTTLSLDATFALFLILIGTAGVAIFSLTEIRSRIKLFNVGLGAGVAAALLGAFVGLLEQQAPEFVATQAGIAGIAALLACSVVLVILPVIERAFKIATSMTLLEWADTSAPLLKQLIQRAPGTWQHSHLLGSMAEAAAEEINANGLLVRVGAYYHDVGKMCKPEYFVENQQAQMNVHNRLAPHMSLLVIVGHVKDGLALAREYALPKVLHPFIAEHHGTTVVRYFHARAAANQAARARPTDDREVDETDFRYPGPKPSSRESAILMLCDGVEGAVRTLADPTPARIETLVHDIAIARLMDGQLDECDLTLRELAKVEQSLVKSLCSIYHGRIAYPQTPPVETAAPRSA